MLNKDLLIPIYRYCAYQDRCTQEVVKKLRELEATEEEIPNMLVHLEAERFLDDKRFAHSFARGKFRYKKWGRLKIRQHMQQKGLPGYLIQEAISEEIDSGEYYGMAYSLMQKKLADIQNDAPLTQKQKLHRYLSQKGYEWDIIQQVWKDRDLP